MTSIEFEVTVFVITGAAEADNDEISGRVCVSRLCFARHEVELKNGACVVNACLYWQCVFLYVTGYTHTTLTTHTCTRF